MSRTRVLTLQQGEDLRAIATRELGSATRWVEIARINNLRLPFIIASYRPADRLPHTLVWGDQFLIPWSANADLPPTMLSTYGRDVAMDHGQFQSTPGGDLATVGGVENMTQALTHRVRTLLGELTYHPRYGCNVILALGLPAAPFSSLMASAWVQEALKAEPRVFQIHYVKAEVAGDTILVTARLTLVGNNSPTDLNLVLNP
jgi:phage baseplate assembly protein W